MESKEMKWGKRRKKGMHPFFAAALLGCPEDLQRTPSERAQYYMPVKVWCES